VTVRSVWSFTLGLPAAGERCIQWTATNTGLAAVTLTNASIRVRGLRGTNVVPKWVLQTPRELPLRLEPGDHWTGLVLADEVKYGLDANLGKRKEWKICPIVGDSVGRGYRSRVSVIGLRRRLIPPRWLTL
jgi:hypothetical protein